MRRQGLVQELRVRKVLPEVQRVRRRARTHLQVRAPRRGYKRGRGGAHSAPARRCKWGCCPRGAPGPPLKLPPPLRPPPLRCSTRPLDSALDLFAVQPAPSSPPSSCQPFNLPHVNILHSSVQPAPPLRRPSCPLLSALPLIHTGREARVIHIGWETSVVCMLDDVDVTPPGHWQADVRGLHADMQPRPAHPPSVHVLQRRRSDVGQ